MCDDHKESPMDMKPVVTKEIIEELSKSFIKMPVKFNINENDYSLEWQHNGLIVVRIWPPEDGFILIELHNVRINDRSEITIPDDPDELRSIFKYHVIPWVNKYI